MAEDVMKIGKRLVELCKQTKWLDAVNETYAPNIVSIEAAAMPGMAQRTEGLDKLREKTKQWEQNTEVHSCEVAGPWPNGDRFIALMKIDCTAKAGPEAGKRMKFDEACLYTVKNGKVVQDEFFYATGPMPDVAQKLYDLCNANKAREAVKALYADDVVTIEPFAPPGKSPRTEGMAAHQAKTDWWENNFTVHSAQHFGPWPHGDRFIVHFIYDVTGKAGEMAGQRMTIDEMGLYTTKNGKITEAVFFYSM